MWLKYHRQNEELTSVVAWNGYSSHRRILGMIRTVMLQLQRKHFQRVRKKQEARTLLSRQGTECLQHEYSAAGYGGRGVILSVIVSALSADFVIFFLTWRCAMFF
jgi:hypothetical protein